MNNEFQETVEATVFTIMILLSNSEGFVNFLCKIKDYFRRRVSKAAM